MCTQTDIISFNLPKWLDSYIKDVDIINTPEKKMEFVIEASRLNIKNDTGGPFSAAVFEKDTNKLISLGTNLVTTQNLSILHAEIVALSIAQKKLGSFDLGKGDIAYELVTTTEPCAMCFGAIPWSGVKKVICGASDSDARAIGFDEGEKVDDWAMALEKRGIEVIKGVMKNEAAEVLKEYLSLNGHIYNSSNIK